MQQSQYTTSSAINLRNADQLWLPVIIFFMVHQAEEVLLNLGDWRKTITLPAWASFTDNSFMYALGSQFYTGLFVVGQCMALLVLAYLLRKHSLATKLAASALLIGLMLAFILHIALSLSTQSFMPGIYTSIFPGLPVGGYLLYWVWRKPKRMG
ncbi:MAG TPA: HXXEE domain-containing protein [Anaerolineales bacterium]|nr:HXXEE domain-containing protein [Anaerolineales bacterium]